MTDSYIIALVNYALDNQLIEKEDYTYAVNAVLEVMQLDSIDLSVHSTDYSDASLTIALDINNRRWATDMLRDLKLNPEDRRNQQ